MTKDEIRENTSMKDVLARYGVDVKNNRCRCFIHGGHNYNLSIYKDKAVHCFVCGESLDVFGVVQHFENCDFREAMKILGSGEPCTPTAKLKVRMARIKQTQYDVAEKVYDNALRRWCALDYIISYYKQTRDAEVYPYYVYAMQNLSQYQQELEESEAKLFELRRK